MSKIKKLVIGALALVTSFVCGSAVAAVEPTAVFTDFTGANTDAGITIGGYTLKANGNTVAADGITITQDLGVTVEPTEGNGDVTVIVEYSDFTVDTSAKPTIILSARVYGKTDNCGVAIKANDSNKLSTFIDGNFRTTSSIAGTAANPVLPNAGRVVFSYSASGGAAIYAGANDGTLEGGCDSAFKWSGSSLDRIAIGSKRNVGSAYPSNCQPATGMKIKKIAVVKGTSYLNEAGMNELAAYKFPDYIYKQGTNGGWGGNCNYTGNLNGITLPATDAAPAGTKVEVTKMEIAESPSGNTDNNRPTRIAITVDGKTTTSADFVSGGTISASGGNNPVKLTYNFPAGCVLTVGTQATIKWLKADGSEISEIRYAASNDATGRFLSVNNGNGYSPIALLYGCDVEPDPFIEPDGTKDENGAAPYYWYQFNGNTTKASCAVTDIPDMNTLGSEYVADRGGQAGKAIKVSTGVAKNVQTDPGRTCLASTTPGQTDPFTVSCIAKITPIADNKALLWCFGSNNDNILLVADTENKQIEVIQNNSNIKYEIGVEDLTEAFHTYVVVGRGSNTVDFYVDGVKQTAVHGWYPNATKTAFGLASFGLAGGSVFSVSGIKGAIGSYIDDFRVYRGVALTDEQVAKVGKNMYRPITEAEMEDDAITVTAINALPALADVGPNDTVKLTLIGSGEKTLYFDDEFKGGSIEIVYDGALKLIAPAAPIDFAKYDFTDVTSLDYAWIAAGSGMAINFKQDSGKLGDNDEAGIPGLTIYGKTWNNVETTGSVNAKLFAADGSTVLTDTIPVEFSGSSWSWGNATTPYLKGYIDDGSGVTIKATVPFGTYDLYIICATDTGSSTFSPKTVNGVKYTATANGEAVAGTAGWGASQQLTPILGKNVMRVSGLTAKDLTINSIRENGRGCIAAIVIVKPIPEVKATATITEPTDWSDIEWDDVEPAADIPAEITFDGGSLNIDEDVECAGIKFKDAAVVSAGDYTFPAIDAATATSLTVNGGTIEFSAIPSSNITIADGATLKFDVSAATTINGIAGAGTFLKTGTAELTLNNGTTYVLDGGTLEIAQGNVKMNNGNSDPQVQNATIIIGANGSLNQNGWFNVYGTITFDLAADKTVFNSTIRTYDGMRTLVKKGAGELTFGASCNGDGFGTIIIEEGAVAFAGKEGFIKSGATFDFAAHDKTSAVIAGNFTFSDGYTFKFPADWAAGETFQLCSGTLSGIPEGGKIEDYSFYCGDEQKTATFNLSSNGSVFYNYGVKQIAPEGDYAISTLNGETIAEGQTVELTMKAGSTLTIDDVAKVATSVLCDGILLIEGADGAEPTAEQLAALNFEGVTGKIVKKWLATMGVININLVSGRGAFPDGDTSDDGMLAGNTPKSSWINVTGATGSTTEITEWKTLTQESAAVSGMTFTWDANTVWSANQDIPILNGYLDDGNADGVTLTLTGVPYTMYDVIVYLNTDNGSVYPPITVNGVKYTWDATNGKTIVGTDNWGSALRSGVQYGQNALRISDLEGNVTIHTAKGAVPMRACVPAIQIVEVPTKEYRRTYEAADGEDVTTSFLNEYIAGGDEYTGPFTLTLNGGKFIANADFICSALAINSATDLTIEKATSYTIPEAEIAKIAINEFTGNKITYVNLPIVPASAPAAGKTYRWEGDMTLPAIPYIGSESSDMSYSGVVDIACGVSGSTGSVYVFGNKAITFSNNAAYTTSSLVLGNKSGVTQNITQNGGEFEFTKTGSGTTTSSAFVLGHWSSTVNYNLVGGTITVPNDNTVLGWDGAAKMTIGGDTSTAKLTTKGIATGQSNNKENALTIGSNGTLSIGAYGANLKGATTVTLNGGTLEAYETCTFAAANANGIQVTADSTINIPEGVTLTISAPITGSGTAAVTGAGTFNAGKTRDFSNLSIGDGITLVIAENVAEDGEATLTFAGTAPATVKLVKVDGTTETLPVKDGKVSYTPSVAGKACWMDYEFEGNLNNVGTDTTGLSRDGSDFGPDASADFRNGSELYTGTHPYRGVTYPEEWTCAIYGSIPEYGQAALITFGTQSGGLIGLIKGLNATDDTVYLVRTTGNKKYEVLAEMTVPNATTAQHLYAFVKTDKVIEIYLDGKHWKTYNSDSSISFGGGLQIASVHGGAGSTGIVRFDKALFGGDTTNEILRKSVIGMMRLYNCVLGPKAMKILSEEFPYVSPNGLFTRALADGENGAWNETDAWTKVLEGSTEPADVPDDKAMVRIATSEEAATLAINLDAAVTTEALELSGNGALTVALAEGKTAGVANSGSTTISAPLTIKYGALSITGGPTAIEEGGSITFDYSAAPEDFFQVGYIPLTGDIAEQEDGVVTAILPTPVKSYLAYSFGYSSTDNSYGITVAYNREPTTLYLTATTTISDDTLFATDEGGEAYMPRLFAEDVVVVPSGITMTIPTTALAVKLGTIDGAGTISATNFTLKDSSPLFTVGEDWTGTVEFTYLTMSGDSAGATWFDLNRYGNANSKVTLTGTQGFMKTNTEFLPEVTLVNNNLAGLEINDGSSYDPIIFSKVKGAGNFIANATGNTTAQKIAIGDASELVGQIWMRSSKGITLGSTTSAAANNQIVVADGATITFASQQWLAEGGVTFGDTLTVIGEVGSYITMPEPTAIPEITLVGAEGDYKLVYAEGKLTVDYADVTFTVPAITGATPFIEGYTIGEDGSVTVPYGESVMLVYTANNGKLFNDGKTTVNVQLDDIIDADATEATIAEAIEGKSTADAKAKIGSTLYLTLKAAIDAVQDEPTTVIAIGDQELTEKLEVSGKTITIDGDTFTEIEGQLRVVNGANVTIGSYITLTSDKHPTVFVRGETAKSTLTINGFVYNTNTEFDATFTISGNGNDAAGADIVVNSYVVNDNGAAIYFPQPGTLTLTENAMVQGYSAIIMKDGTLNVADGAAVYASGAEYIPLPLNRDGATPTGDAIVAGYYPESYGYGVPVLNITGGTFTTAATDAKGVNGYDHEEAVAPAVAKGNILISGGTFDKPVNAAYCKAGFIPADNGSGNYGVKHGFYLTYVSEYGTAPATKPVDAVEVGSVWQYALTAEDLPNLGIDTENNKRFVAWDKAVGDVITADTTLTATWEDAEVEVVIPTIDGATPTVEGYEIKDGKVSIPYGSDLTVVYTANGNKLFSDGATTKKFEFTNVKADPQIDVSGISTVDAEAKTGGMLYLTLKEAIDDAGYSAEVNLLKNVELEECISVSKPVSLNIGAFKVTPKGPFTTGLTKDALFAVRYGGGLDISGTGGSIDSSSQPSIYSAIKLTEKGETSDGEDVASLTVNEGVTITGYYYGICGNGTRGWTDITINGGTITAAAPDTNLAIFNPQPNSTVTISGGTLIGLDSAIEMRGGSLEVMGGTLTAKATDYDVVASGSGNTTKGAAVAVAQHNTKGDIYVSICDAELKGVKAVSVANPQGNDTDNVSVELGSAIYNGALAFDADGNATVWVEPGIDIELPEGYLLDADGYLVKATAKIGTTYYLTLEAAVEAVQSGETIDLLEDVTIGGITIPSGKNFTMEFGLNSITFQCPGAGSAGTKTIGFQILEGSTVVFQNGTIQCSEANKDATWQKDSAEKGIAMVIQNYADLTLKNMQIDGTNIAHNGVPTRYVMSNNSGSVAIEDSYITAAEGDFAFDTCKYGDYDVPSVTVGGEFGVFITGNVELSGGNLALNAGTLDGELVDGGIGEGMITKANAFVAAAPAGYVWKNGVLTKASAKIGTTYYLTLAEAVEAADGTEDIELLADCEGNGITIAKSLTIDFGGKTYTVTGAPAGSTGTKSQAFQILSSAGAVEFKNGTISSNDQVKMLVNNYTNLTLTNMTLDGTNMGVAHKAGTEIVVPNYTLSNNSGTATLTGGTEIISKGEGHFAMDTYDSAGYAGIPTVIVDGATITGDVELSGGNLALNAGTLDGELVDGGIGEGVITKANAFVAAAPAGYVWKDGVLTKASAKIGTTYYLTLAEAVEAADGAEDIVLLADCEGNGITIAKSLTIDFGGKTYTVTGAPAGSTGTKSQAFQILSSAGAVEFKNGTISSNDQVKMLVNNYTNLTLTNMTLDGTNMGVAHKAGTEIVVPNYTLSNNSGTATLTGGTEIISKGEGHFAMDTYDSAGYAGIPTVIVDGATITGDVELSGGNLALNAGTLDGKLVDGGIGDGMITKADTFEADAPEGYIWKDGKLVKATAKIGTTYYLTLAEAITAVEAHETIELLADMTIGGISIPSGKNFVLEFNEKTITFECPGAGSAGTKTIGFQILEGSTIIFQNGTIQCSEANKTATWESTSDKKGIAMLIQNYANLSLDTMTIDGTNIAHNGVATRYVMSNNSGAVSIYDSIIKAAEGDFAFDTCKYGKYNVPTITVDGSTYFGSSIEGNVELSGGNLKLVKGSIDGELVDGGIGDGVIIKGAAFDVAAPDGYVWNDEGYLIKASAKIGSIFYLTLADAVKAAKDTETVELLASCTGDGIKIDKSITIDFGGFTYTVDASLVGSPSTQSQAFNLVSGKTITLKNGTITSKVARMLVQNYANLTLEDMILDGSELAAKNGKGNDYVAYTLSNCDGDTVIKGETTIVARSLEGQKSFAFDTYYKAGTYEDATVTVDDEDVTIMGDIELAGGSLALNAGTLNGSLVAGANIEKGTVTKADTFEADAPEGYIWKDGKLVRAYVAKIGTTYYLTLNEAVEAAEDGAIIEIVGDPKGEEVAVTGKVVYIQDTTTFSYVIKSECLMDHVASTLVPNAYLYGDLADVIGFVQEAGLKNFAESGTVLFKVNSKNLMLSGDITLPAYNATNTSIYYVPEICGEDECTLDLNGHKISQAQGFPGGYWWSSVYVNCANLTITDSSVDESGVITGIGSCVTVIGYKDYGGVDYPGKLTLEAGTLTLSGKPQTAAGKTYYAESGVVAVFAAGEFVMNGGTIDPTADLAEDGKVVAAIAGGNYYDGQYGEPSVAINGGTVVAVPEEQRCPAKSGGDTSAEGLFCGSTAKPTNTAINDGTIYLALNDSRSVIEDYIPAGKNPTIIETIIPTAKVEEITPAPAGLNVAAKFTLLGKGASYDNWNADFIVTFDKDIAAGDVTLKGQYGNYPWTALPDTTYEKGVGKGVMATLGATISVAELAALVPAEFNCGVVNNKIASEVGVTVQLVITDGETVLTVGEPFAATLPANIKPEATVEAMDPLPTGLAAAATFTVTEAGSVNYADYTATFTLTANNDVAKDEIMLAGQYTAWSEDWIDMPLASDLTAGEPYTIIAQDWATVASFVETFNCGLKNIKLAKDTTFAVTLTVAKDDDTVITLPISFEVPAAKILPTATVTPIEVTGLDAAAKFAMAGKGISYDDWKADFIVTFDTDIAAGDVTLKGQYGEYDWTALPDTAYEANVGKGVMATLGAEITVAQLAALQPAEFNCGVVNNKIASNVGVKVQLVITDGETVVAIGEPFEATLPAAAIVPTMTVAPITPAPFGLDTAATFSLVDKGNGYGDWNADFIVTFDKDIAAGEITLKGQYDAFGQDWVDLPATDYTANVGKGVMATLGASITVDELAAMVPTFNCGIKNNTLTTAVGVKVQLVITKDDKTIKIGEPFAATLPAIVAKIGTTYFLTLNDAINAAKDGDKVELLADVETEERLEIAGKAITLDLGESAITYTGATQLKSGVIGIHNGAGLTIEGTTGGIYSGDNAYAAIALTLKGDTPAMGTASIDVKGGNLVGYYYGITGNGSRSNTAIIVEGGTIKGTCANDGVGIYHPEDGAVKIIGGTIEGAVAMYVKAGMNLIEITGGEFIANGNVQAYNPKGSGFVATGDALVVDNMGYPGGTPNIVVKGGTYTSANGYAIASYAKQGLEPVKSFVSNGYFKGGTATFVPADVLNSAGSELFKQATLVDSTTKLGYKEIAYTESALPDMANDEEVLAFVDEKFTADDQVKEFIDTVEEYNALRNWAKINDGVSALTAEAFFAAKDIYFSYATDQDEIVDVDDIVQATTVKVIEVGTDGEVCQLKVSITGLTVGIEATPENLKNIYKFVGSDSLLGAYELDKVEYTDIHQNGGNVDCTIKPDSVIYPTTPKKFFYKTSIQKTEAK